MIFTFFTFGSFLIVKNVDKFVDFVHDITLNVCNRILKFLMKVILLITFHRLMSMIAKFIDI